MLCSIAPDEALPLLTRNPYSTPWWNGSTRLRAWHCLALGVSVFSRNTSHYPFSGAFCKGPSGLGLPRDIPPIRSAPRPRASRSSSDSPILTRPQRHALAESVIFLSVPFASPLALLDPSSSHIDSLSEYPLLANSTSLLKAQHSTFPVAPQPPFSRFASRNGHPSGTARAGRISGEPDTTADSGDFCLDGADNSVVGRLDSFGVCAKCLSPVDNPPGRPCSRTQIHTPSQTRYAIQCA